MSSNENKGGRPAKSGKKPFTAIFQDLIGDSTQQDVADKIGVSRQNVGKWLSGTTTPDIDTLCRIANAYDVTTDYLLGRTYVKSTNTELKAVCEYTGLSEKSVLLLSDYAKRPRTTNDVYSKTILFGTGSISVPIKECNISSEISKFLEDEQFIYLLNLISQYIQRNDNPSDNLLLKYYIKDLFENILNHHSNYPF